VGSDRAPVAGLAGRSMHDAPGLGLHLLELLLHTRGPGQLGNIVPREGPVEGAEPLDLLDDE
ncbi:MAG: hypothetical protein PVF91_11775, partial [Chromatiales bacterium]